ncbi:MAG: NAD(P)H-binding protein [Anaerolineae bacterium]|nr:NAD(P)H-binding protein [Anaerolineae bacterium]
MLVTGATGFLGYTLCPYLVTRGYRLRAFVRTSSDCEFLRLLGVELAWGDIRDPEAARAAVEGCRANVSGRSLSHREINGIVDRLLGYHIQRLSVSAWMMLALAWVWTRLSRYTGREPYYPIGLASHVFCDWEVSSEKAQRELGFEPMSFHVLRSRRGAYWCSTHCPCLTTDFGCGWYVMQPRRWSWVVLGPLRQQRLSSFPQPPSSSASGLPPG